MEKSRVSRADAREHLHDLGHFADERQTCDRSSGEFERQHRQRRDQLFRARLHPARVRSSILYRWTVRTPGEGRARHLLPCRAPGRRGELQRFDRQNSASSGPVVGAAPFESGTSLLTPFSSDSGVAELTLAHQMAHAMFVSPRPWIAEGVAHFEQALWREHQSGRRAALDYMGLRRTTLADAEKFIPGQKQDGDDHSLLRSADDDFYRSKAMFVWWMLRDMLGDAVLRQIFSLYDPSKDATQSYLQDLVQAQSGRNFSWFFSDWIYQDRGLPDFR